VGVFSGVWFFCFLTSLAFEGVKSWPVAIGVVGGITVFFTRLTGEVGPGSEGVSWLSLFKLCLFGD
jgi:hypothetical protein